MMKILLAVLMLIPLVTNAQEQTPDSVMAEFAQSTVMQLMCIVHYEKLDDGDVNDDKIKVFAIAPLAHAAQHGIPAAFVTEMVAQTLPEIRLQWDQMSEERKAGVPEMCETTYTNIKPIVDAYIEWLNSQEDPNDVMTLKDSTVKT